MTREETIRALHDPLDPGCDPLMCPRIRTCSVWDALEGALDAGIARGKAAGAAEERRRAVPVVRACLSAIDRLMGDSDLPEDDSFEMKASQRGWRYVDGRKKRAAHVDPDPAAEGHDDQLRWCRRCGTQPHRFRPSPEAGPFWRCSECGEPEAEEGQER